MRCSPWPDRPGNCTRMTGRGKSASSGPAATQVPSRFPNHSPPRQCRRSRRCLPFREASHEQRATVFPALDRCRGPAEPALALADRPERLCRPEPPGDERPGRPGAGRFQPAAARSTGGQADRNRAAEAPRPNRGGASGPPAAPGSPARQGPAAATAAGLQDTRQTLEARIAQVEQALDGRAAMDDLEALRTEVEQIKARQATVRAAAPAKPRSPSKPTAAMPEPPPLPFRIVGVELRAGQRSVSVAPATGDFTADQVQVLLPGDAVGPWRLQAVESNTAVFQAGEHPRRLAIP